MLVYVFILLLTFFQLSVVRKLSSILATIVANLLKGAAKVIVLAGTQGRAETSNMPNTHLGRPESFSR